MSFRGSRLGKAVYLATVLGAMVAVFLLFWPVVEVEALTLWFMGREVILQAPKMLLLAVGVPLVWLYPLFSLSDLPMVQRVLAMVARTGAMLLVILALARPSVILERASVETVFLVDVSQSVPDGAIQAARGFISEALAESRSTRAHLVTFAEEPVEVPLVTREDGSLEVPEIRRHGAGLETDLEAALKMTYGMFHPGNLERVVLLTDGNQTKGDVLSEAGNAARFGVVVHYRAFQVERPPEVLVADMRLPEKIEVGSPFTVAVEILSTRGGEARVDLWQDDYREGEPETVTLEPGVTRVELPATVREPGLKRFRVELSGARDTFPGNNSFTRTAMVKGRPRVLMVEGEPRKARYLQKALRAQGIELEVRGPMGIPSSMADLESYDMLILSDVPATFVSNQQMKLISQYVRGLGGGFLMTGGENSLGLGGYFKTPLERLLPVRLDSEKKRTTPSLAMVLVIDKSGSMGDDKIELAKEAAKAVVELLDPGDRVGIVAFDSYPEVLVRLQPARNRVRILDRIARLRSGGGTEILAALEAAYDQISLSAAQIRHVILLTDGQSPAQGIPGLVGQMSADGITISTVAVGNQADRRLLSTIAEMGGGRSYFTRSMRSVPRIFTKETQTVARNALVETPFRPVVVKQARVFDGVPLNRSPYLLGYVSTRPRKGAEVLLETEQGEPLLARWRVGLGTSVVWTSDLKNRWSVEWLRWRYFGKFWAQLVRDTMRRRKDLGFELQATVRSGVARVVLDAIDSDDRFVNGMSTTLEVSGPGGWKTRVDMEQVASGRYEARFRLPSFGSYTIKATHSKDGRVLGATLGGLANPYPTELRLLDVDLDLLDRVARTTGGIPQVAPGQVFDAGGRKVRFEDERRLPFLLAAIALFLIDLLLRRVRLWPAKPVRFP